MARAVGLIGRGKGPLVHIGQECTAQVRGLVEGSVGITTVRQGVESTQVMLASGEVDLGLVDYVSFEHQGGSPNLFCNVLF